MKNIRIYTAEKYASANYEEVESNIYKTYESNQESDNSLSLAEISASNVIYVTSLMFEQEKEYGENVSESSEISQYPLEDVLDKFFCAVEDFYEKENQQDDKNSYIEFSSPDIDDIRNLLSIVGKHVYNKEEGEYVELVIE